jgi:hypothetical protein
MQENKSTKRKGATRRSLSGTLRLIDVKPEDERPDMALFALDRAHQPIHLSPVDKEGRFEIPNDVLEKSTYIAIASESELEMFNADRAMTYRTRRFQELLKESPLIGIPKRDWYGWLFITRCVSGKVSHCYPWPWFVSDIIQQAVVFKAAQAKIVKAIPTKKSALQDIAVAKGLTIKPFPYRCEKVCDGIVEVYRRTCCCYPYIVLEPRLPELLDILEDLIERIPIPWPPIPQPDPPPFFELPVFRGGLLDEMALNAPQDLAMLRSLPDPEKVAYIQARPYLLHFFCTCSPPVKVAQGTIRDDGGFSICWKEPLRLMLVNW